MEDIALSFDASMFTAGINKIEDQLVSLNKGFTSMAQTGSKRVEKVQLSAMNLMGTFAKVGVVVAGVKGALNAIPEIGQTFKIAGDILKRNLLWPLRQFLVPLLQSVLDWVRDNRALFVKMGSVIANVFRTIFSIIKSVVDVLKNLWNRLSEGLQGIFGKTTRSVTEMANMVLFKITAIVEFVLMTLQPFFNFIIDNIVKVVGYFKQFFDGFVDGFGDVTPLLKQFGDMWERIGKLFDKILPGQSRMNKLFKALGTIIGTVVITALTAVISALDLVITKVEQAINRMSYFNAWRKDNHSQMKRLDAEYKQINKGFQERQAQNEKMLRASFSATGGAIKDVFFSTPKSSVKNTKNVFVSTPKSSVKNTNSNVSQVTNDNKVVNININESKNPRETAREVQSSLNNNLRESRFRSGGR